MCAQFNYNAVRTLFRFAVPATFWHCQKPQKPGFPVNPVYRLLYKAVTPFCHIGAIIYAILAAIAVAPLCRCHYGGLRQSSREGNETMAIAFYALLIAGLAIGIYGVIDAVRNFKGLPND